ncbi:MAG: sugar transferase [Ruminococcus flavefaciens]|nr:sugar transferase [Ruminococcus flavefaciens]MCM1060884.1 sugar transferase [Eubacterium sp.]
MKDVSVKDKAEIRTKTITYPNAGIANKAGLFYLIFKRIFDFISSLIATIVILIPVAVIALIIFIKDPGNPFYMQERVGQSGQPLKILKFRTMKKNADHLEEFLTSEQLEEYKKEYKLDDDPRLIGYKNPGDGKKCFGAKIRQWSVDELPQIVYNICLLGNMSVVGPRPVLSEELSTNYTEREETEFLSVKPGLTGYWQAYARNDVGYEEHKRQDMELYYVRNCSFGLDMKIVFKTVMSVLQRKGAK